MAQLNLKIKLYAKSKGVNSVDFLTDVIIEQPVGEEAAIKTWNLSIDEPTTEQLNSFETAGNTAETLKGVLNTRANEYKQLKPARFNWIKDNTNTQVDGFLAHEVSSIVPEAIQGEKDAFETYKEHQVKPDDKNVGDFKLDEDGNKIPLYQGIDQSKLIPLLVKTIQELEARIKTLEDA